MMPDRVQILLILLRTLLFAPLVAVPLQAQQLFTDQIDLAATEVDRIYVKGLQYLSSTQTERGNWDDRPYGMEPGVVGLTMVSILAHGDDPNHGPYALTVSRALDFILSEQTPRTGYIGRTMYNHGFATLALAEAYGSVIDERIGPALELAINLILTSQSNNPKNAWRYSPESKDADTTVSGAQMVALFAARNAGLSVPHRPTEVSAIHLRPAPTALEQPSAAWCWRWPSARKPRRFNPPSLFSNDPTNHRAIIITSFITDRRPSSTPLRKTGTRGTGKTSPS